jgi:hypothetical protein
MDNDVHRFSQNAREGQWCPIGPTMRTGRVLISLPQSPPVKQDGSYRTIREGNRNASYKESSGERRSSSNRPSHVNFFGWFGDLTLDGHGRKGCPRLTLHEEVTQPGLPQKECGGVCPNQPHAGVGPGWSRRDRGPQPSWCPNRTPGGHGRYPQAVVPRAWKRALATVMNNAD